MSRSIWKRPLAATAALAAVLLAGCAAIPSSGPVEVGLTDLQQAEQSYEYNPEGPVAGASQEDIVRGFVRAATSNVDDYAVAREFLTPDYAEQWDPGFGVLIDEGTRPYRAEGEGAGVLSLTATAKVDARGLLLPVEPGPTTDVRFEFERTGDEWRISSAPAGIILDRATFSSIWSPRPIYFIGPGGFLVPETRWFLSRTALATEIVGALLEGPSEHMRDVVRSGFPTGTALVTSSVPIVEGRARIDLTGELLEAGPQVMSEVTQQVSASLKSVTGVSGFDLLIDGTPMRDGGGDDLRLANGTSNPSVLIDGRFGTLVGNEFEDVSGFGDALAELDPRAITLAPDGSAAAVLGEAGVSRVDGTGSALIDGHEGQVEPSYDAFGFIWTVQRAAPQTLSASAPDGTAVPVAAPWLAGFRPVSVRLSPDGSRIAALVTDDDQSLVLVAGVVRDEAGTPVRTTENAEAQLWTTGEPVDFDWVDQSRFAALTRLGGASRVTLGGVGLFPVEQGTVPDGMQITGGGGRTQIRVLGAEGDLFTSQGSGWQRSENDISILAKRG